MLLGISLGIGFVGFCAFVAGYNDWPFMQLVLGHWGPAGYPYPGQAGSGYTQVPQGPGKPPLLVPVNPNRGDVVPSSATVNPQPPSAAGGFV